MVPQVKDRWRKRRNLNHCRDSKARPRLKREARYDSMILTLMAHTDHLLTARGIYAFCVHYNIPVSFDKIFSRMEHLEWKGAVERMGLAKGPRYDKRNINHHLNYLWRLT